MRAVKKSRLSPKLLGVVAVVLFLLVGWIAFQKEAVSTFFTIGGETIEAEFAERAKLIDDSLTYVHQVKLNGVIIGKVTDIEETEAGTMIATLLVEDGTRAKLGTAPTAAIRPTLVTDGVQNVLLETGGVRGEEFTDERIPLERTILPVALDDVLVAIGSDEAVKGTQTTIKQTEALLREGGTDAIRGLVEDAPATLRPTGAVLEAVRGSEPEVDLSRLVVGLQQTSDSLTKQPGQFSSIVADLRRTTAALAAGSAPLAQSIATGPETLRITRAGLADLRPTLHKLKETADDFGDSAEELDEFLAKFGEVIDDSRPTVEELKVLLADAEPLLQHLAKVIDQGSEVFDDIDGPAFDDLNGPIKERLYAPFKGENEYKGGGSEFPTYKELAYLLSDSSAVWQHYDANTAIARLEAGGGGQTFGGTKFPMTIEQYLEQFGFQGPIGPNEGPGAQVPGEDDPEPSPFPTDPEIPFAPDKFPPEQASAEAPATLDAPVEAPADAPVEAPADAPLDAPVGLEAPVALDVPEGGSR